MSCQRFAGVLAVLVSSISIAAAANKAPTIATPASASSSTVTGTTVSLSVLGADDSGEAALTYTWSSTGPGAVAFSANGSNGAKSTVATFAQPGAYSFTATVKDAQGLTATNSVSVTVQQTVTGLTVAPSAATLPSYATQQFTASASDQFGSGITSGFSWSATGGGVISADGVFAATTPGGPYTITASLAGQSASATVTVTNTPPTITSAASATPSIVSATSASLSVAAADDGAEAALTYVWSANGPAPVSFSANGTNAAKNVVATFTSAGEYAFTVVATDSGGLTATSSVNVTVTAQVTSVTISPPVASLVIGGSAQFTATAADQFGAPLTTAFTWNASGGGTVSPAGLFTASSVGGPFIVTASAGSSSASAQITVANQAPTIATAASASPATVTSTFTTLSVLGADDSGESALTYTWSAKASPAPVSFSENGTNAAKNTTVTFTRAGSYTFAVTVRDAQGLAATSSVSVTVNQTLASISVWPAVAGVPPNVNQQFTATGVDQFGGAMSVNVNWTLSGGGSISKQTGLFRAGSSAGGPWTVTATAPGGTGTASVMVTAGSAPAIANAAAATPAAITSTTTSLAVLGADDGGESALTYTWSSTGSGPVSFSANGTNAAKNTTATFSQAGSYTLRVAITDAQGLVTTSGVNVTVQSAVTSIAVSPQNATVGTNSTLQFSANGVDQFGASPSVSPLWTVSGGGSISTSGLFSATTAGGPFTVTASSNGQSGSASFTVAAVNQPPTIATGAKGTPSSVTGTTTTLSVLGADDNGEAALVYTWSVSNPPAAVSYTDNGTNTAKSTTVTFQKVGSYNFTVTVRDAAGLTATSSATVTVNSAVAIITLAPPSATIAAGGTQTFTASAVDQFGAAASPTFSWAVAGGGTISQSGIFTAGANPGGPYSVSASAGGKSGTAAVAIAPGTAPTIAVEAASASDPVTGTQTSLSVLGADDLGESTLRYSWSSSAPNQVTFAPNDSNAAKNTVATFSKAGSYDLVVTATNALGLTASSLVTVTVNATPLSVSISPTDVSIAPGEPKTFTASVIDQFNSPIDAQVLWSANGGGVIDGAGVYTADTSASGTFIVTATAGSASASTSVTVLGAPATNGDTTPPDCSWVSPSAGGLMSGVVVLEAAASDDVGVSEVRFEIDNLTVGVAKTLPFSMPLDTSSLAEGDHTLIAIARDDAGNEGSAGALLVRIARPEKPAQHLEMQSSGCSVAGNSALTVLAVLVAALILLHRRRWVAVAERRSGSRSHTRSSRLRL